MKDLIAENKAWVDEIWGKIDHKLKLSVSRNKGKIPYTTVNGVYDDKAETDISWWTNGFWPGMMWLMYIDTKDDLYKETAVEAEVMLDKALGDYACLHHDVGFMWNISSGVNYRLFGGEDSRNRWLTAASTLASRYNISGKFIRAWNGEGNEGWTIIDCMMNIPLLYRVSEELKDPRFRYIALSHADTTMRDHVRPDGSVNHIVSHDVVTGDVIETIGGQGYGVGSTWSRGQAWALYGFILSYIHTGKQEYLDTAKSVAHYFISCVCDDYLPKCDFRAPQEPVIYDSTAGACAACGLIEIANHVPEFEKDLYLNAAIQLLKAMEAKFCNWNENEDSILGWGTEAYHNKNTHHIPIIYGDYFFIERAYLRVLFW